MISQLQQYVHHSDGTITLACLPGLPVEVIQEQGKVTARDLERELGLPHYFEEWEAMAKPNGFSPRQIRFVLLDESQTRLPGSYRLRPKEITLPPTGTCYLEFGHKGFLIGVVSVFYLGFKDNLDDLAQMGIDIPMFVEGDCMIAQATLFNSPLADKAWEALQCGVFTHVCPLILKRTDDPIGAGQLTEVSLVTGDYPGIPGARIMKWWEA